MSTSHLMQLPINIQEVTTARISSIRRCLEFVWEHVLKLARALDALLHALEEQPLVSNRKASSTVCVKKHKNRSMSCAAGISEQKAICSLQDAVSNCGVILMWCSYYLCSSVSV